MKVLFESELICDGFLILSEGLFVGLGNLPENVADFLIDSQQFIAKLFLHNLHLPTVLLPILPPQSVVKSLNRTRILFDLVQVAFVLLPEFL
jgi:hypothetical protein